LELLCCLSAGIAIIVGIAAVLERFINSSVWRRTLWQATIISVFVLLACEVTGSGPAMVGWYRFSEKTTAPADPITQQGNNDTVVEVASVAPQTPIQTYGHFADDSLSSGVAPVHWPPSFPSTVPSDHAHLDEPIDRMSSYFELPLESNSELGHANESLDVAVDSGLLVDVEPVSLVATDDATTSAMASTESNDPPLTAPWYATAAWWAGLAWLFGTVGLLGRMAWQRALLLTFCRQHRKTADAILCRQVDDLARRLQIKHHVRVLQTAKLRVPAAFGVLRPTIALPLGFREEFDAAEQQAILAHEVAHLSAGDPAWQFAAGVVCAIVWWHPLAWLARRRLTATGEAAADEASLLVPQGPDALAGCLVAMGRRLSDRPRLGWLSVGGPRFRPGFRSDLGRRVERLLNLSKRSWHAPGRVRMAFAKTVIPVTLLIVAITCTAWARPQVTLSEGGSSMNMLTVSWHRSLAAAALLALTGLVSDNAIADDAPEGIEVAVADGERDGEREVQREGDHEVRREGDREREEGEREVRRDGDQPREEGDREDRVREGDRPREEGEREVRRDGDHTRAEGDRENPERREAEQARRRAEAEERAMRERRANPDEFRAAQEEIERAIRQSEEMANAIRRKLKETPENTDAAHILRKELGQVEERLEQLHRRHREIGERREVAGRDNPEAEARRNQQRHAEELLNHRRELEERAGAIRRELEGLRDDQDAEARELHGAMEQTEREMREVNEQLERIGRPDAPSRDVPPEMARLEEIRRQIARLSEAGHHEEAEQLKREGRELLQRMQQRRPDRPGPDADFQRRMDHIRVAAENLHAAGMPDAAEQLMRDAERMMAEMHGQPQPPRHPDGPPPEEIHRIIGELHGQMEQMHREMQEMREQLQHLMERQHD